MITEIKPWFTLIIVGLTFGFFPAFWWNAAEIIDAWKWQNKKVPRWLIKIAEANPLLSIFYILMMNNRNYLKILRITAIMWMIVILGFIFINDFLKYHILYGNLEILQLIFFIFVFLGTVIIPSYFLKRYLNKLEKNI